MTDYFDIAITPTVLQLQQRKGARGIYTDRVGDARDEAHKMSDDEIDLLVTRDSFYLSSVSETGWPYVQHRGGDLGFVKILGASTIGWAERKGNRQYVGTGNITATGKVAAIFVDYPSRTRLKVYGMATHHPEPSDQLLESLGARHMRQDGAITIDVLATDWNCPKYITPRFTEQQIDGAMDLLQERIADLEAQLADIPTGG